MSRVDKTRPDEIKFVISCLKKYQDMILEGSMEEKKKERRNQEERRSGVDRRRLNASHYTGIEKRSCPDCRDSNDRRNDRESWVEYLAPVLKK